MNDKYVLETENLTKKYGKVTVVDSVNIKIPKGEIYALLGKNGAGKTTTMCMILKLINKSAGNVNIFGNRINSQTDPVYKTIGSLIETPGFYHDLTGEENLKLFSKLSKDYNITNIHSALKLMGLLNHKDKLFKNYSLGMKQRLAIALALLKNPDLLILDEPINGLDPVGIVEVREILKNLSEEYGMTILISSHILNEIEQIADVIGIMENGKLIEEISMSNLQSKFRKYVLFQLDNIELAIKIFNELGIIENKDYIVDDNNDIRLFNYLDMRGSINKVLVESDIEVLQMSLVKQNLEEYFTNIIGDDFNA